MYLLFFESTTFAFWTSYDFRSQFIGHALTVSLLYLIIHFIATAALRSPFTSVGIWKFAPPILRVLTSTEGPMFWSDFFQTSIPGSLASFNSTQAHLIICCKQLTSCLHTLNGLEFSYHYITKFRVWLNVTFGSFFLSHCFLFDPYLLIISFLQEQLQHQP